MKTVITLTLRWMLRVFTMTVDVTCFYNCGGCYVFLQLRWMLRVFTITVDVTCFYNYGGCYVFLQLRWMLHVFTITEFEFVVINLHVLWSIITNPLAD
jgi:drug/metabolite transporter superfamily protein YnfA